MERNLLFRSGCDKKVQTEKWSITGRVEESVRGNWLSYLSVKRKKKDYSKVMELDGDQTQATIKRWNGKKIKNGTYYLYVESIYEDGDKQAVSGAVNCWDTTGR